MNDAAQSGGSEQRSVARTVGWLAAGAAAMFAFAFALVPLYEIFCEITDINGKLSTQRADYLKQTKQLTPEALELDAAGREVKVQLIAINNESLPWEFAPNEFEIAMRTGEARSTSYRARNLSSEEMTVQAVPSVSPGRAAQYISKMECFCFERQTLAPGEQADMGLRFELDPELPGDLGVVSLSYTLFDVGKAAASQGR